MSILDLDVKTNCIGWRIAGRLRKLGINHREAAMIHTTAAGAVEVVG